MRNVRKTKKKPAPFQLLYLKNDAKLVDSSQVGEIDFEEVKRHLEKGECVYISCKSSKEPKVKSVVCDQEKESRYFLRS